MRRQAPPFHAIEAFLVAARSESFRKAAEVLEINPSAVSRRIQALEAFLGRRLINRDGGPPTLSVAGHRYLDEIEASMEAIRRSTATIRGEEPASRLRLVAPHSLAMEWLTPRLGRLRRTLPDVDLELRIARSPDALTLGRAEVALLAGPRDFARLPHAPLLKSFAVVVAAPELLAVHGPISAPADLAGQRLLSVTEPADLWAQWARSYGFASPLPKAEAYQTLAMMYEAAAAGLGVAIGVTPLVDRFIAEGRLVPCFGPVAPLSTAYYLVFRDEFTRARRDVSALTTWLTAEAAQTLEQVFVRLEALT